MQTCMYKYMYTHMHVYLYMYVYVHIDKYKVKHLCMYACVCLFQYIIKPLNDDEFHLLN